MPCLYSPPLFCGTDGLWVCPSVFFCPALALHTALKWLFQRYNKLFWPTQELLCLGLGVQVIFDSTSCALLHEIVFSFGFPSLASCFLPLLQRVHWVHLSSLGPFVIYLFQLSRKAWPASVLCSLLHYSPSVCGKPYLEVQDLHFSGRSSFFTPATCSSASSEASFHPGSWLTRSSSVAQPLPWSPALSAISNLGKFSSILLESWYKNNIPSPLL